MDADRFGGGNFTGGSGVWFIGHIGDDGCGWDADDRRCNDRCPYDRCSYDGGTDDRCSYDRCSYDRCSYDGGTDDDGSANHDNHYDGVHGR